MSFLIAAGLAALLNAPIAESNQIPANTLPTVKTLPSKCRCPDETEVAAYILEGIVVDAEVTLTLDGLSTADRKATIFNVTRSGKHDLKGRTKIWHSSNRDQCGIKFDYGRRYKLAARKTEDGALETDECLMRSVLQDQQ